jgi:hypothetical protein
MRRRLALVGATLLALVAAGPGTAAALYLPVHKDHPLVYKAMPSAQPVPKANPIRLQNPPHESDLFKRFLEWLKTRPR